MKRSKALVFRLFYGRIRNIFRNLDENRVSACIFSKDRPLQLEALLRSMQHHCRGELERYLIWRASNEAFRSAYEEVFSGFSHDNIHFIEESDFQKDTIAVLERSPCSSYMFLVDDLMFVREFRTEWLRGLKLFRVVPSVRLDERVTYSQPHGCDSPPPRLRSTKHPPWRSFSWTESTEGWAMPLALDGNVFDRRELLTLLKGIQFRNPNSLEGAMGPYRFWFKYRKGYCLPQRCIQNFALNRVQTENSTFPCGEFSADALLEKWEQGFRLDIEAMAQMKSNSTHIVCEPLFEKRPVAKR